MDEFDIMMHEHNEVMLKNKKISFAILNILIEDLFNDIYSTKIAKFIDVYYDMKTIFYEVDFAIGYLNSMAQKKHDDLNFDIDVSGYVYSFLDEESLNELLIELKKELGSFSEYYVQKNRYKGRYTDDVIRYIKEVSDDDDEYDDDENENKQKDYPYIFDDFDEDVDLNDDIDPMEIKRDDWGNLYTVGGQMWERAMNKRYDEDDE